MDKQLALAIADHIDTYATTGPAAYEVESLGPRFQPLQQFHQWTNGKPLIAGYRVSRHGEEMYYLLFIDWHRNDNYYVVLYLHNRTTTAAEIRDTVQNQNGISTDLIWKYNPLKRDGKNAERKAYFQQIFGTTTIQIPLPISGREVEPFFHQLFALCRNRLTADRIVDKIRPLHT